MFTHFFIKRPVFASVCSILIVLLGVVGYTRLPVQEYPSIDPPIVTVTTTYPGASPEVVETEVTEILEESISGIEGVKTMTSTSRQSVSQVTLQFNLDRDLEAAAQDVRGRVARARGDLPDDVEEPIVEKASGDDQILWFGLYGEDYSLLELSDYADQFIISELESVDGISSIFVGGERKPSMRIWLDPQKLAARDLTVLDVETALQEQNLELPGGVIEGDRAEYSVRTLGRLREPDEYEDLILRQAVDGSRVVLGDVGRAEIGAEDDDIFVRLNGTSAIALGLNKISRANTLAAASSAKEKMAELSQNFPEGMQYIEAYDPTRFVSMSIQEAWTSLGLAIALVILVIFVFLHDWRATIIPAVTIPVSLIGAFAVMFFLGFSINTLTLFSLTLATGLVVDDSIVVLENIIRYIKEKRMDPFPAAFNGIAEVVFAVIATTVVLVAVFMPVAFSTGAVGRLFNEFALTLAGAVILSSFVALTLAPAIAARVLRPMRGEHEDMLFIFRWFESILVRARQFYRWSLLKLMRLRLLVVISLIAALGATTFLFQFLPGEFLPTDDRGFFLTIVQAPQGVSLNYTSDVLAQTEDIVEETIPQEVENRFAVGGFAGSTGTAANQGIMFTTLNPWSERTEPQQSQQAIIGRLFGAFIQITDALVFPFSPSGLPGASQSQPVQFVLQGNDLQEIASAANALAGRAQSIPELVNVRSNLQIDKPELTINVDRPRAAALGVSIEDISRTLQILLGSQDITSFNEGKTRYEVVVQAEQSFRATPEDIEAVYVRSRSGEPVPLGNLVDVSLQTTAAEIGHFNRFRAATIEASPAPGYTLGQAIAALESAANEMLPPTIQTRLAGESLEFREAGQATLYIFSLALAFIFLVLAAQFESYLDPIIILLAVPLSLLGAFITLLIFGQTLNVYSQIGLIMLIGLATKNSILLVEFANQQREQGLSIVKAAVEAGEVRFRPILMTAFSTIFGLMPLALSTGAGAASRIPLGLAVIGGMIVSTFLSLYIVPVFYAIVTTAQTRLMHPDRSSSPN